MSAIAAASPASTRERSVVVVFLGLMLVMLMAALDQTSPRPRCRRSSATSVASITSRGS